MSMEYWRYGANTEDKRLFVQFTDDNGQAIDPEGLTAWGIKLVTKQGKVLHKACTLTGFSPDNVVEVTVTGVVLFVPAALNPKQEIDVYAVSILELPHPELAGGKLTDVSEKPVFLWKCKRDYD
jgi:hypothetical protein